VEAPRRPAWPRPQELSVGATLNTTAASTAWRLARQNGRRICPIGRPAIRSTSVTATGITIPGQVGARSAPNSATPSAPSSPTSNSMGGSTRPSPMLRGRRARGSRPSRCGSTQALRVSLPRYRGLGLSDPGPPGAATVAARSTGSTAADLNNDGYRELLGAAYGRSGTLSGLRSPKAPFYSDLRCQIRGWTEMPSATALYRGGPRKVQEAWRGAPDDCPSAPTATTLPGPGRLRRDGDIDLFIAVITHRGRATRANLSALLINRLESSTSPSSSAASSNLPQPDPETGFAPGLSTACTRPLAPAPRHWNQGDLQAYWPTSTRTLAGPHQSASPTPNNHLRVFCRPPTTNSREPSTSGPRWPNCPAWPSATSTATAASIWWQPHQHALAQARPKAEISLWKNTPPAQNGFLWVRLIGDGRGSNRNAIGARLFLTTESRPAVPRADGPTDIGAGKPADEATLDWVRPNRLSLRIVWPTSSAPRRS